MTIHVLPGMGADHRMYIGPWKQLPDAILHDWPEYTENSDLNVIAKALIAQGGIKTGDIVVGSSLGGIVAGQIAAHVQLNAVVLIGSAQAVHEINPLLEVIHPLIELVPISFVQKLSGKMSHELTQSFHDSDPRFIRAMCKAIFKWSGFNHTNTRLFRIHGAHDLVIPPPQYVDLLLSAGHLVAVSHPSECVNFIKIISDPVSDT